MPERRLQSIGSSSYFRPYIFHISQGSVLNLPYCFCFLKLLMSSCVSCLQQSHHVNDSNLCLQFHFLLSPFLEYPTYFRIFQRGVPGRTHFPLSKRRCALYLSLIYRGTTNDEEAKSRTH